MGEHTRAELLWFIREEGLQAKSEELAQCKECLDSGMRLSRDGDPDFCSCSACSTYLDKLDAKYFERCQQEHDLAYKREPIFVPGFKEARQKIKADRAQAIARLGGKCEECDYDDPAGLEIDHIYSDGAEHRRTSGGRGAAFFADVVAEGRAFYQLLCGTHHNEKTKRDRDAKRARTQASES